MSTRDNSLRTQKLRDQVIGEYAKIFYTPLRIEALRHTTLVEGAAVLLARKRNLDGELLGIAALLHDYARFARNQNQNHARLSAAYARTILEETGEFSPAETGVICQAISCHSAKERVDGPLAETLKDADVLAAWMEDPASVQSPGRVERLEALFAQLNLDD